jgi:hypothetical protein
MPDAFTTEEGTKRKIKLHFCEPLGAARIINKTYHDDITWLE